MSNTFNPTIIHPETTKMHLSCGGKAGTGIFHRQKGNSSWTYSPQQTTRPSQIFTNVLSAISWYFITAMGLCPLTCEWIPVLRTWPISAYLRSIPTTANAQPAFLNYDTSAGMPHPPVGSRSSVLQIKPPLCCRFGTHLPMFWRPTPPPAPPVPEAAAAPLLLPPGLRLPPACGFMDMVIP